jgi:hypothetical protein
MEVYGDDNDDDDDGICCWKCGGFCDAEGNDEVCKCLIYEASSSVNTKISDSSASVTFSIHKKIRKNE